MKKPVRKVRGYQQGGKVVGQEDPLNRPSDFVDNDQLSQTYDSAKSTPERLRRYVAAREAQASATTNEANIRNRTPSGFTGESMHRDVRLARADYPGFRKGGKVKAARKK